MNTAPAQTSKVPTKDHLVKGSPRIRVAQMELKTSPEACKVERTGRGRVVIWMELPTRLLTMNMSIPSCHLRRLKGGRRGSCGSFSSSRI